MNIYADSMGVYTLFNGVNSVVCGQSLRNRWNVTGQGGDIFCEANKGNRGNPALNISFGGLISQTFVHRSTYILGLRLNMSCLAGVGGAAEFITYSNDRQPLITLQVNADGSILVYVWNNSTKPTILSIGPVIAAAVNTYLEFKATVSGTTILTISCEVIVNSISLGTGTVVTDRDANSLTSLDATFNRITLNAGVANNGQTYISDLYLNDDTGGFNNDAFRNSSIKIDAYPLPNADGSQLDWTPDTGTVHFSRINENPADGDTSYIKTSAVGNIDSLGWQDLVTLTDTIPSVQLSLFARSTDEGPRAIQGTVGNHGAELQTDTYGLYYNYAYHHQSINLDPNGAIPWTPANFNAKEFGAKLVA